MAPTTYTLDPDGDLVLILSKPPKATDATSQKSTKGAAAPSSNKRKRDTSTQSVPVAEPEKINMTVSSKHMMLASPVFKAMLQPGAFREGIQRNAAGQMEVDLPDDDPRMMVIVLNIVHARNRLVPKQVDLELMTQLAILIDKYQMVEVVESFSNSWINDLLTREMLPTYLEIGDIDRQIKLRRWLAVSWVFRRRNEFLKSTKVVIIYCGFNVADELDAELPVPEKVIESISRERETKMSKLIDLVKRTIKKYEERKVHCPCENYGSTCDSAVLGSIIKSMVEHGAWPIPEPPYKDFTLAGFRLILSLIHVKTLCSQFAACCKPPLPNDHGVRASFEREVDAIAEEVNGLDIKKFKG